MLADQGQVPHTIDTDVHSTVHLPDSFAVGLAYRPLENLSFEVGTVFTRWSTYDSMNIYFDSDFQSINHKKWRDGWNFNASVEYEHLDWLALRAGIWYETPVTNEAHADFMVPVSYTHLDVYKRQLMDMLRAATKLLTSWIS